MAFHAVAAPEDDENDEDADEDEDENAGGGDEPRHLADAEAPPAALARGVAVRVFGRVQRMAQIRRGEEVVERVAADAADSTGAAEGIRRKTAAGEEARGDADAEVVRHGLRNTWGKEKRESEWKLMELLFLAPTAQCERAQLLECVFFPI